MSIADHFEHVPNAGLTQNFDSNSARRQFDVSLVLIVVVAMAALALGMFVRFERPAHTTASVAAPAAPPSFAGHI